MAGGRRSGRRCRGRGNSGRRNGNRGTLLLLLQNVSCAQVDARIAAAADDSSSVVCCKRLRGRVGINFKQIPLLHRRVVVVVGRRAKRERGSAPRGNGRQHRAASTAAASSGGAGPADGDLSSCGERNASSAAAGARWGRSAEDDGAAALAVASGRVGRWQRRAVVAAVVIVQRELRLRAERCGEGVFRCEEDFALPAAGHHRRVAGERRQRPTGEANGQRRKRPISSSDIGG